MNTERMLELANVIELAEWFDDGEHSPRLKDWRKLDYPSDIPRACDPMLQRSPMAFDMEQWTVEYSLEPGEEPDNEPLTCRTAGCLAGHAIHHWPDEAMRIHKENPQFGFRAIAGKILGVPYFESHDLFCPDELEMSQISPENAADVLRLMAEDGFSAGKAWRKVMGTEYPNLYDDDCEDDEEDDYDEDEEDY